VRDRKSYFVYIMGSMSGTLYIGVTGHPEKRVFQHKEHVSAGFTSKYGIDRLLYWESYDDVSKAIDRENNSKAGVGARKLS
jgi:putative endonuclease